MDPDVKEIEPAQYATDKTARSTDEDEVFQRDWSDDEERRAKRKLVWASGFTAYSMDQNHCHF
jgi:hypothetical protein